MPPTSEDSAPAPDQPVVLAIETSCDETAVAILRGRHELLASEISSQIPLHQAFGGVVPEVASRSHLLRIQPLIDRALTVAGLDIENVDAFAATAGPGLASSLLIGNATAKGLAMSRNKPFLSINHMEGHLLSPWFGSRREISPAVCLIVSGGHTLLVDVREFGNYKLLGRTLDDAAGEAFDKVGKLLGLPYPGGPEIDKLAAKGDPHRYKLPRSMIDSGDFNFSFSGVKTAVRYLLPKLQGDFLSDLCASFQEAVVEVLVDKTVQAAAQRGRHLVTISGGVCCNTRLRAAFTSACQRERLELLIAPPQLATDNAAMIAYVAAEKVLHRQLSLLEEDINPNLALT